MDPVELGHVLRPHRNKALGIHGSRIAAVGLCEEMLQKTGSG